MVYELLEERIKLVPENYLEDIKNYIDFILYKANFSVQNSQQKTNADLSKYFGAVKFPKDALQIQKDLRDEWR